MVKNNVNVVLGFLTYGLTGYIRSHNNTGIFRDKAPECLPGKELSLFTPFPAAADHLCALPMSAVYFNCILIPAAGKNFRWPSLMV